MLDGFDQRAANKLCQQHSMLCRKWFAGCDMRGMRFELGTIWLVGMILHIVVSTHDLGQCEHRKRALRSR